MQIRFKLVSSERDLMIVYKFHTKLKYERGSAVVLIVALVAKF